MPDDVIVDEVNGLIRVKSVGDFLLEELCKSMDKILALMKKHRIDCLLIDTKE